MKTARSITFYCLLAICSLTPSGCTKHDSSFRFTATGDPRSGLPKTTSGCAEQASSFRFTVTGDPRSGLSKWKWTLHQMADKVGGPGAFHITAGDYYQHGAETVAADFYETLKARFGDDVVWFPGVGNHELGTTDMPWLRKFYHERLQGTLPYKINPGPPGGEETTYSWDYRNAHFVQINQFHIGTNDEVDNGHKISNVVYNWLVDDLNTNTKPVIFVIYHKPLYPLGRGGKDGYQAHELGRFWKLLRDKAVVAGLCADSHTYGRGIGFGGNKITWEIDAGNAGRTSHGDKHQTFIDVTVRSNGTVEFNTWQGTEGSHFRINDTWTVNVPTPALSAPKK